MIRTLIAAAALVAACPAQTAPCIALNDVNLNAPTFVTSANFSGPNITAFELIPAQSQVVFAMQVAIANTFRSAYMGVEVWSDDPVTNEPMARLAGGTWRSETARIYGFQGANFDNPVSMAAGTRYWLVLTEPGFSNPPEEVGGVQVPGFRYNYGTMGWTAATFAPKYRLFCTLLDGFSINVGGGPCASSAGVLGTAFTNEEPAVGNAAFAVEGSGFPVNSLALLVIGYTPGFPSVPLPGFPTGCTQSTLPVDTVGGITAAGVASTGHVIFPLPVPNQASLVGLFAGVQLGVFDPGASAPIPFVTTNSLELTVF